MNIFTIEAAEVYTLTANGGHADQAFDMLTAVQNCGAGECRGGLILQRTDV